MYKITKSKFIKKYWFNIVETDDSFSVINTRRRKNQIDRDGLGYEIASFKTLEDAEKFLEDYEKNGYEI